MKESKDVKVSKKVNLRTLDDVSCSNIVVSRQIRRLIGKFPSFKCTPIDCWVHGGHYIQFESRPTKFVWKCDKNAQYIKGLETISSDSPELSKEELNKLIIFTHRAMCDMQNGVDLTDTPEDLLAYAETKLQELLAEEDTNT